MNGNRRTRCILRLMLVGVLVVAVGGVVAAAFISDKALIALIGGVSAVFPILAELSRNSRD